MNKEEKVRLITLKTFCLGLYTDFHTNQEALENAQAKRLCDWLEIVITTKHLHIAETIIDSILKTFDSHPDVFRSLGDDTREALNGLQSFISSLMEDEKWNTLL